MFNNKKLSIFSILAIILALTLGGIAIVTSLRLSSQPSVSPTVPQIKPRAADSETTPACTVGFTVNSPVAPVCNSLAVSPNNTKIIATGETRALTATASGGYGNLTYVYSVSNTGGASNGILGVPSAGPTATWTAPDLSTVTITQTWTISVKAKDSLGQESAVGNCTVVLTYVPVSALKCNFVALTPNSNSIIGGSETRILTASASGGVAPLTYSWDLTSSSVDKGSLSSFAGQSVTWTAPGTIVASESWKITATVKDSIGKTDSSGCVVNLTANPPNQACNSSCNSKIGCPQGLGCVNGQCRNISCPSENSCSCPPVTSSCNSDCTDSSQCPANMACTNGKCRNPSCTIQADCTCPPPPVVSGGTHKECRNSACVTLSGAGADTCTSDVSCRPIASPPKIPPSGVELPTILVIVGGTSLLLLGILVVL